MLSLTAGCHLVAKPDGGQAELFYSEFVENDDCSQHRQCESHVALKRSLAGSEVCSSPVPVHALTKTSPGEVIYSKIGQVVPDSNHSRILHVIETCQRLREVLQTDSRRSF